MAAIGTCTGHVRRILLCHLTCATYLVQRPYNTFCEWQSLSRADSAVHDVGNFTELKNKEVQDNADNSLVNHASIMDCEMDKGPDTFMMEMANLDLKEQSQSLYRELLAERCQHMSNGQCNKDMDGYLTNPTPAENGIAWRHPPVPHVEASLNAHLMPIPREASYVMMPEDSKLKAFVHGMEQVNRYKAGDILPSPNAGFRTHLPMQLWYDEGHEEMECKCIRSKSRKLLMTFQNSIQLGNELIRVDTLIDSGASHCFLDRQNAEDYGFTLKPHRGKVNCAGNGMAEVQGSAMVTLQIQGF